VESGLYEWDQAEKEGGSEIMLFVCQNLLLNFQAGASSTWTSYGGNNATQQRNFRDFVFESSLSTFEFLSMCTSTGSGRSTLTEVQTPSKSRFDQGRFDRGRFLAVVSPNVHGCTRESSIQPYMKISVSRVTARLFPPSRPSSFVSISIFYL